MLGKVINYQDDSSNLSSVQYLKTRPTVDILPPEFDSFRIGDNKFVVFNQSQINIIHLIKLKFDNSVAKIQPNKNKCDICRYNNAYVYCLNDKKRFCNQCNQSFHKLIKDHQSCSIDTGLLKYHKCWLHPESDVLYYCPKCHLPICMECKVHGNHAHGEFSKHKLTAINKIFEDQCNNVENEPPFSDRLCIINAQINNCKSRIKEIEMIQKKTENEIMRIAQNAIEESRKQNAQFANVEL